MVNMETIENKQDTTAVESQDFRLNAEIDDYFEDTPAPTDALQLPKARTWEEQMALDEAEMDAKNSLKPLSSNEDYRVSQLDGFTIVDNTRVGNDDVSDDEIKQ